MKKLIHSLLLSILTIHYTPLLSQELKLEGPGALDEYIGQIKDEHFFVGKAKGDYYNARVFSVKNDVKSKDTVFPGHFPGNITSTQKEKNDLAKHHFKWFIIDSNIYSIYKHTNVGFAQLTIYKFDSNLNSIDSFLLLSDDSKSNFDFEPIIRIYDHTVGVVSPLDRENSTFVFASFNMDNNESFATYFQLNKTSKYSCSDFTFNSKNNFFLLLEGTENFVNETLTLKVKPDLVDCQLVSCIEEDVLMTKISSHRTNEFYRSFKFHKTSDDSLLLCGLVFESNKGLYFNGYRISQLNFNTGLESNEQIVLLQKVKNNDLLSKKDIKSTATENHYDAPYQHLKEIIPTNNGSYIFISEGHNLLSTSSLSITNTATTYYPTLSFFETKRNFFYCSNDNIFVSCFENSTGIVWTTKTILRFEDLTMKYGAANKEKTYFTDIIKENNQLNLYFPQYPGLLKSPPDYRTNYQHPTIAKFSIDLINGTATLKEIDKTVSQNGAECFVVSATCFKNAEELFLWIQSKNAVSNCNYRLYSLKR